MVATSLPLTDAYVEMDVCFVFQPGENWVLNEWLVTMPKLVYIDTLSGAWTKSADLPHNSHRHFKNSGSGSSFTQGMILAAIQKWAVRDKLTVKRNLCA